MKDTEGLCEQCRGIDFDGHFRSKPPTHNSELQTANDIDCIKTPIFELCDSLAPEEIYASTTCPLCLLFLEHSRIRGITHDELHANGVFMVRRGCFLPPLPRPDPRKSKVKYVVGVQKIRIGILEGLLCYRSEFQDSDERPQPLEAIADLEFAQRCFEYCRENHRLCQSSSTPFFALSLIDCSTLSTVNIDRSCTYAALSYVWGASVDQFDQHRTLPDSATPSARLPKTILDAVSICLYFKIPYLWVDRYCIDYSNPVAEARQINNMHRIYRNAELTLIAKAGVDAEAGLPGVQDTPRDVSAHVDIGNIRILRQHRQKDNSKWVSRGWTLQEEFFSRRRLAFTDEEFVFQCSEMTCWETEKFWLDNLMNGNGENGTSKSASIKRTDIKTRQFELFGLRRRIESFVGRDLSLESDSLQAFAGVLQYYSEHRDPIFHVWGVPFIPYHPDKQENPWEIDTYCTFLYSLCWFSNYFKVPESTRRPCFPSWSWTGWRVTQYYGDGGLVRVPKVKVLLEYDDGIAQPLESLFTTTIQNSVQFAYPRALHLQDALVLLPTAIRLKSKEGQTLPSSGYDCVVGECSKGTLFFSGSLFGAAEVRQGLDTSRLEIIVVAMSSSPKCLVLQHLPDGRTERVGSLYLEHFKTQFPSDEQVLEMIGPTTHPIRRNFRIT